MATFNRFDKLWEDVAHGVHAFNSHTIKVALTNTLPVVGNAVLADITQIAAGGGYVAGGSQATVASSAHTAGVYKLTLNDVTFTGPVGSFRYAVIYNDTPTSPADPLIGWLDYGASLSLLTGGDTFTVDFSAVTGALTIG